MRCFYLKSLVLLLCVGIFAACDDRTPLKNQSVPANPAAAAKSGPSEKLEAGKPFLDFTLPDTAGKQVSLKDFRGRVVIVNLWATWCVPCVTEMPALERLYQSLHASGLDIVAITVDSPANRAKVDKFVNETGLSFPILFDPEMNIPPQIGVTGFPETFFVGPEGQILAFLDPEDKRVLVRVIRDRPWDSPAYVQAVKALLQEHLKK